MGPMIFFAPSRLSSEFTRFLALERFTRIDMNKLFLGLCLATALAAGSISAVAASNQNESSPSSSSAQKADPASDLAPTAEDYAKARAARDKAHVSNPKYVSNHNTVIEEHYDNNRLVDVKVTPGSTEIPYTMTNRGDKPIDSTPGQDPHNTLGTPKFIHFGW